MTGTVMTTRSGDRVTIRVAGHFGFPVYREFRDAYVQQAPDASYLIDLQAAEYMDSAALGMLLVLREHVGNDAARIEIANCNPGVRKILAIAHFDRLFSIR
jgi:anti-anti-sigma factor